MTNTRKCLYARIKKVKKPSVFIYRRWRMRLAIARKKLRKFRIPAADDTGYGTVVHTTGGTHILTHNQEYNRDYKYIS